MLRAWVRYLTRDDSGEGPIPFVIMVANPADVLTYQAAIHGAFPAERVIGTGTLLDSTRLRSLLADRLQVDPRQVYAYMLGEHGDSQSPCLSGASVAGIPLAEFPGYSKQMVDEVARWHEPYVAGRAEKIDYFGATRATRFTASPAESRRRCSSREAAGQEGVSG